MKNAVMRPLLMTILTMWIVARPAQAALVVYAGGVENSVEIVDWRTGTTLKTFDIDGDNIYGSSLGAVHWRVAAANQKAAGSSTFGWAFISSGSQFINGAYADIDHVNVAPANTDAGIALGGFTFELTGTSADYFSKVVRVGVMEDVLGSSENALDVFKGVQLLQVAGGSGNSGVIPIRSGGAGNGQPDMYFFDLYNAKPGDRFALLGLNSVGGTSPISGYIGPVSIDIVRVPEPATMVLLAAGVLGMGARRRRVV